MKVLVTGATGFIGTYVIQELLKRKVEVVATSSSFIKAKEKDWFEKVTYVEYDIRNASSELHLKFHSPDVLIHLAWQGLPNYKKLFHFEEELMRQYFFLKSMIEQGIQNINVTGTCFEYGMQEGCLSEELTIANPTNAYSIAKDSLRKFLSVLNESHSFSLKWLRLFYMYGDGQNENSILPQLQRALDSNAPHFNMSQGEQVRDYLKVEEVAKYIVACALQTEVSGIINIASNQPMKVIDLVKSYLSKSNKTIDLNLGFYPYPEYEPFAFWGDNAKLKKIVNTNESDRAI